MVKAVPLLALGAMAASGAIVSKVPSATEVPQEASTLNAHESNAAASLVGQFRTNTAAWMWLRTDLYLHNGVELRPMTDAERALGVGGSQPAPGHELHDESAVTTVVPPPERDFRGWMGDVERSVSTYQTMKGHVHNDPKSALPLFRLMTVADPRFVQGWVVGAMVMAQGRSDAETTMALAFLREGLKHNPKSPQILADLGRMTIMRRQDLRGAMPYLKRAVAEANHAKEMGEADREALQVAFRLLALTYRDLRVNDRMRQTALAGLILYPDDAVLWRIANPAPIVLKPDAQQQWLLAENIAKEGARPPSAPVADSHDHSHDDHGGHDHDGHDHEH